MMLVASIVSPAAVALAYQLTLPQISSSFPFVGDGSGTYDTATNAVPPAALLIVTDTAHTGSGQNLGYLGAASLMARVSPRFNAAPGGGHRDLRAPPFG